MMDLREDYKLIRGLLNEQLDKMRLIKNVVAKSRESNGDDIEVCFEFYVIDDKIFFPILIEDKIELKSLLKIIFAIHPKLCYE